MNPQIVTAAIILRENKVLVARRAPGEKLAGKWEFPGGKLQEGESLNACLEREILEELGVVGITKNFLCESIYTYSTGTILLQAYLFDWVSGDITLTVHDEIQWLPAEMLSSIELAPADIPIAKVVKEYINDVCS